MTKLKFTNKPDLCTILYIVDFLSVFKCIEFLEETGCTKKIFRYIYTKYCGFSTPINKPYKLYYLLEYYKHYPLRNYFRNHHSQCFELDFIRWENHLSSVINELDNNLINNRLSNTNRIPLFPNNVTACLDTFPIYIRRPKDSYWQNCTYNGKYKSHVLKIQAVTDHSGSIIWWSGPHIGTIFDSVLWRKYKPNFLLANERLLADKAYVGCEPQIIHETKKSKNRRQSIKEKAFNRIIRWNRATVEHTYAYLKRFHILSSVYRGRLKYTWRRLQKQVKILIHISVAYTRHNPLRFHL